ncbi:MAG: ankyrin repeat domain-containing protein [Betaproteobacteria bacterium]|nr:ankyrin repeat domain-containing protein [Betaproteobacteria bacterium]
MKLSALRRAIEKGNLKAVMAALDQGADIEETDIHGDSGLPLRIACFKGLTDIVCELIRRGADIHAPNAQGTGGPIRMAHRGGHHMIVGLLLAHGAELPADLPPPKTDTSERRKRGERRIHNSGPPKGFNERRFFQDRRVTSVREIELDATQWEIYFAQTIPAVPHAPFPSLHDPSEHASSVLARARD